jgi:hypothetical protein
MLLTTSAASATTASPAVHPIANEIPFARAWRQVRMSTIDAGTGLSDTPARRPTTRPTHLSEGRLT